MDRPVTPLPGTKAIGPEEGKSFWQPVPANGFVRCILSSTAVDSRTPFSIGTQTVAPKSYVREHTHDHHDEIIHFLSGSGVARLEGVDSEAVPGTTVFIGANRRHSFHNPGGMPLTFIWILMPGGLDEFFEAIGRPKGEGELPPAPFPRPLDVQAIEQRTVFGWADQSSGAVPR
jgi:quercetin dioxygenase-like cupin family protein